MVAKVPVSKAREKEMGKVLKLFLSSKTLDAFDEAVIMDMYILEVEALLKQHERLRSLLKLANVRLPK